MVIRQVGPAVYGAAVRSQAVLEVSVRISFLTLHLDFVDCDYLFKLCNMVNIWKRLMEMGNERGVFLSQSLCARPCISLCKLCNPCNYGNVTAHGSWGLLSVLVLQTFEHTRAVTMMAFCVD